MAGSDRDVGRFDRWAAGYDQDRLQKRFFGPVHARTLTLVSGLGVTPRRVLDIGCGTGALLRAMAQEFPGAEFAGVDAAGGMVRTARQAGIPAALAQAGAAALPFGGQVFDLVTSTVSFHHWEDQRAGLAEVGRVLAPGGVFVLADLHAVSYLRVVYTLGRRRGRMHTKRELTGMLGKAGLRVSNWAPIFDLDVLLPLRARRSRPPTGRVPLVTAVVCRRQP
jgi:ubiquinone/menaquinone biosynthesis C-methylase UbiE